MPNAKTPKTPRFAIGATREERYANARKALDTARGRPRKGSKSPGSRARSLRLPDATWADLKALAAARKMTVHRLLRVIIAERLYTRTLDEEHAKREPNVKEPAKAHSKARKASAA